MTEIVAVLLPGLALGGALAAGAAWSRVARPGPFPHLGVGAAGAVGIALAGRLAVFDIAVVLAAVLVTGLALGALVRLLDRAALARAAGPSSFVPDLVVLAAAFALTGIVQPATATPLPLGPLGGQPGPAAALTAAVLGLGGALLLVTRRSAPLGDWVRWALFGCLVAVTAVLASGAVGGAGLHALVLPPATDPGGFALRVIAAGLAGRDPADAAAAGFGLGIAEAVVRAADPLGGSALLPAALAGLLGLAASLRAQRVTSQAPRTA